jgi:hypothetical protein
MAFCGAFAVALLHASTMLRITIAPHKLLAAA